MKNITFILSIIVLITLSGNTFAQNEESAIKNTVEDFLLGGTNGDVNRFKNAFLPDAVQRSIGSKGVTGMSIAQLASKITPNKVMDRTTRILSWSYAGTAATAVTETNYATSKVIDLLNLVKTGSEWKIVSRVYSRIDKNQIVVNSTGASSLSSSNSSAPAPPPVKSAPKKAEPVDDGW